jgi:hypothetical protein
MKKITTFITAGIIAMAIFAGTPATTHAAVPTTVAEIELKIKSLMLQLIEQLKIQIAELQEKLKQEQVTTIAIVEKEEKEYDPTQSDTYPKQTTDKVTTSAKTISVDGATNDYAEFGIEFNLNAFGSRSFISENFDDSFEFSIIDGSGSIVYDSNGVQNGSAIASFSSSADLDNSQYRIDEDTEESFEITLTYNPYGGVSAGNGSYRLRLDAVNYATTIGGENKIYTTSQLSKFRTKSVNIIS